MVGALKEYDAAHVASQEALTTIRENTASRAGSSMPAASTRQDDIIAQLERELESSSGSFASRRAAMRSTSA
ncbi:hypothetical protein FF100_33495 [Methylobacterium terricola]|uniref:Uncharacterized protein n=1 Tax=Methylobacterium terricola TaxID=2583531 RepID=A0A5C4L7T8_9HYPH|nr:hypothetical protein [Methylobacterium terricola]TNC07093.1 hypothetical protein FF100_33495 [Methylobacterium terricola]